MTEQEAQTIVSDYESNGTLPEGFSADRKHFSTTVQGNENEVVYILQGESTKISYAVRDGRIEDVVAL